MTDAAKSPSNPFSAYTDLKKRIPDWAWDGARLLSVSVALGAAVLLVWKPSLGLAVVWKLLIPLVPLILAVAPGLWRNVCPLVTINQLPRRLGITRGATLSSFWKSCSVLVAMSLFFVFVTLRPIVFNHSAGSVVALLLAALAAAFVGGLIFKGRSGWCGTFCPMAPLERVYGQAPLVLVRNSFCEPCVGCQKNCFDFNTRAALFADLNDSDRWYSDHRRLFVAALPGFVYAYFSAPDPMSEGWIGYVGHMALMPLLSVGIFYFCNSYFRLGAAKLTALFGMGALLIFYWFIVPLYIGALHEIFAIPTLRWIQAAIQAVIAMIGLAVIAKTIASEHAYLKSLSESSGARVSGGAPALQARIAGSNVGAQVTEQESRRTFTVKEGQTLLDAIETAGLPIETGCRMGACGADAVVIVDGRENLSEASDDELATLRRLGLEGRGRLACSCRVSGPVTIDLDVRKAKDAGDAAVVPSQKPEMDGPHIVIIGNGIAGTTVAEQLRQKDPNCRIDVFAKESHHLYNRMGLGRVIYGRSAMEEIYLLPKDWESDQAVTVCLNTLVSGIDPATRKITLGTREEVPYDHLVLAMGALPFVPDMEGGTLQGCFALRSAADAMAIRAFVQTHGCQSAVVLGGGVLGVEGADSLRQLGLVTTIVHLGDRLMDRQLDQESADILSEYLEGVGTTLKMGTTIERVLGSSRVEGVVLKNGETVPCDIVLFCAGVRSDIALAKDAGLTVNRGILVDEQMRTSDPHIYAVGDVAEQEGVMGGLWPVAVIQAKAAAGSIVGTPAHVALGKDMVQLKVKGIDVKSFGYVGEANDGQDEISSADRDHHVRRRLVLENDKIVGGAFVNDAATARGALAAMVEGRNIGSLVGDLKNGHWEKLT